MRHTLLRAAPAMVLAAFAVAACSDDTPTMVAPEPLFSAVHGLTAPDVDADVHYYEVDGTDYADVNVSFSWTDDTCTTPHRGSNIVFISYDVFRSQYVDGAWTDWMALGSVRGDLDPDHDGHYTDETVAEGIYKYAVKGMNRCGTGRTTTTHHTDWGYSEVTVELDGPTVPTACAAPTVNVNTVSPSPIPQAGGSTNVTFGGVTANVHDCAGGGTAEYRIVRYNSSAGTGSMTVEIGWTALALDGAGGFSSVNSLERNNPNWVYQFQARVKNEDHTGWVYSHITVGVNTPVADPGLLP
jgi:hypothetical protein